MIRPLALLIAVCLALSGPAQAQIGLPQLPSVPGVGDVTGQLPDVGETANTATGALSRVRELRVEELLRQNRRELEADPAGEPIVRSQILALGMSAEAIAGAEARGFQVVQTDGLGDAGAMTTLRAPRGMSTRRALRALRRADPNGVYDFDHLHLESGAALAVPMFAQSSAVRGGPRVGLIDSGVGDVSGLASQRAFAGQTAIAGPHGRMVASLISSAAPGARIYAADIYGGVPTGGASSALARALTWLAEEETPVINVSLVGPRNRIVETLIARLVARGFVVVAAVGNDGPAAAPLYPASYPGVVGVTGVDGNDRVLVEAGRGEQVDFAARGMYGDGRARVRGTSYAAPIVAGLLALNTSTPSTANAGRAISALREQARDVGSRGRDDVYGYGLVNSPALAAARR